MIYKAFCVLFVTPNIIFSQFKNIDKAIYMCGHRQVQISSLNLLITVQYQNKCSTVSSSLLQNVHREEFILHIFK